MSIKQNLRRLICLGSCLALTASVAVTNLPTVQAQTPAVQTPVATNQANVSGGAKAAAHPLDPAIEKAYKQLDFIKKEVKDYTCTLVKQERIDGKLQEPEYIFTKVRHEPFSIYMQFIKPEKIAGREVIYVHGANNNELIAHEGKGLIKNFELSLKPTSTAAMAGNRYPITEVGVKNLAKRLIEVAESDRNYGECDVQFVKSTINKRECEMVQVVHPVARKNFIFHIARVHTDKELGLPIRYEAYDWPAQAGAEPVLTEQYTYLNLKANVGLTDADFDTKNPGYNYRQGKREERHERNKKD